MSSVTSSTPAACDDNRPLNTPAPASAPTPTSSLNLLRQHGLPSTLPPAPSLKRNYNQPAPTSASTAPNQLSIQHTNLSFLPPSAHKAYQALRTQHLRPPPHHPHQPLPPLPSRSRAPATTPSKALDSFDFDSLFPTADDSMLLETTTKAFGFGFHSFALPVGGQPATTTDATAAVAAGDSSPALPQPAYDFDRFFEDPTPNLDYSPLTSFSASPEWTPQPLFGQAGQEAGVVDDSPLFAAEDSFDFDFSGPSLFGDAPLFPPAKTTATATAAVASEPTPSTAAASAFAMLEASLAHLPVNSALMLPKQQEEPQQPQPVEFLLPTPAVAPPAPPPTAAAPSAVFSPALASSHLFPPAAAAPSPHRQTSSPYPSSVAQQQRPPQAPRRSTTAPTGHRKGVVPEQLLDLEAPTQARSYIAPSATSRKRLPAAFEGRAGGGGKKRKATTEEPSTAAATPAAASSTEGSGDAAPPAGELADSIEAKRRQNTLAARRSRIRKLEHVQSLERSVAELSADKAELVRFAELALRLHPELAAVDGWGARVARVAAEDDSTQPMPAWNDDD